MVVKVEVTQLVAVPVTDVTALTIVLNNVFEVCALDTIETYTETEYRKKKNTE